MFEGSKLMLTHRTPLYVGPIAAGFVAWTGASVCAAQ